MNNYPYWQNPYGFSPQFNTNQPFNQHPNQNQQSFMQTTPQSNVRTVKGREGALSAPMSANSSELFVDETSPLIWYVRTDGAGIKCEVLSYTIVSNNGQEEVKSPSYEELEERIARLEAQNAKSDNGGTRAKKAE